MSGDATRRASPRRIAGAMVWGIVVWCALWGDLSIANVLWGAVFTAATLWLVPITGGRNHVAIRPLAALRFAGWFVWALIRASAVVAWEVVTPTNDINEGIVAVPLSTDAPGLMTLIANTVSLTPGTLTLEVRRQPPTIYVHVLHLRAIEDVRADILTLERLASATFGLDPGAPGDPPPPVPDSDLDPDLDSGTAP